MSKTIARLKHLWREAASLGAYRIRPNGPHITRFSMYRALRDVCADGEAGAGKTALVISGSMELANVIGIGKAELVEADYPEHTIIDLKAFSDESFDFVVSDQVLEHVEGNPQTAFDECRRVLKPGGIAVHTTAFMYPIHWGPGDYWRFTPSALEYLAQDYSEIILSGGWGNRWQWTVEWLGLVRVPVPHAKWHPLHKLATANDPIRPSSTWIVARK